MLANQGQLQTQQISASIGMQESRNQLTAAKGAGAVQIAERGGEQWVQEAEMSRQATLLGMQFGATSGANLAAMNAQANQMNAQIAQNEAWATGISNIGTAAAGADWKGKKTDPDLTDPNVTSFTGIDSDMPANPSIGDFAEINGVMKQWDGSQWVE